MPAFVRRANITSLSSVFALSLVSACGVGGGQTGTGSGSTEKLQAAPSAQRLGGVCPETVVVQNDWEPEAEHGPIYNLVGPGYTVDTGKKQVTGPLVIDGKDTGVKIQVRAGGAAAGYQSVSSQMYIDRSITLGTVTTDAAIAAAGKQPVTAVAALMKKSPQILMWDPKTHPDWKKIADIGRTNTKVVVKEGATFPGLVVAKRLIKKNQLDYSYDGSPSRFVSDPDIVLQGFATAEPYIYQHEVKSWGKPVAYQLLSDIGYSVYPQALSVRSGELTKLSPCLKKLVPVIQKSTADYAASPTHALDVIDDLVTQYNTSWVYSKATGGYAARKMLQLGVLGNETDGSVGSFDMARVKSALTTFRPLIAESGAKVPPDLTANQLATNQFIDSSIGLKTS